MEITYGQLEATLAAYLRIHPDRIGTFRSRIKQLQRLQFPPGVNIGRGAKMAYTPAHLFQMVTAFELLQFALPAQTACNLVTSHWAQFAAGYALAAIQERPYSKDQPPQVIAVLKIKGLSELQISEPHLREGSSSVMICDADWAQNEFKESKYNTSYCRFMINQRSILLRVLSIAKEQAGILSATCYNDCFHSWLPKGNDLDVTFKGRYPDRSNLQIRARFQHFFGNDSEALTPAGKAEAEEFLANDYSSGAPF